MKRWGARLVDAIKHLPNKVFLSSLKGWPTKAKEAPFPHKLTLTPLDTKTVFQLFSILIIFNYFKYFELFKIVFQLFSILIIFNYFK